MESTIDNALAITQKAAQRLFYKKYRGYLRDWDEFFSEAQFLVFRKFDKFDPTIGTFEGYINMYVEFAAIRLLSLYKKQLNRPRVHIGTIEDISVTFQEVPEELDFLIRRALELAKDPTVKRTDSCRKRIKAELKQQGWAKDDVQKAFDEISYAVSNRRIRCYAKKDEVDA